MSDMINIGALYDKPLAYRLARLGYSISFDLSTFYLSGSREICNASPSKKRATVVSSSHVSITLISRLSSTVLATRADCSAKLNER